LDQLNDEARCILYLMVETGMRLSEAANLDENTIDLRGKIPHVRIRPLGRELKTPQSERDIPLVGVSLMAAQRFPKGFPRYRDKSAGLSDIVNKVLKNAGLRPNGQSLYSLRHTFEDRLTAVEAPEKLMAALMGHKYSRPKYGAGPSLEQKREWLQRIMLKPPSRV
jgi:integrase